MKIYVLLIIRILRTYKHLLNSQSIIILSNVSSKVIAIIIKDNKLIILNKIYLTEYTKFLFGLLNVLV